MILQALLWFIYSICFVKEVKDTLKVKLHLAETVYLPGSCTTWILIYWA